MKMKNVLALGLASCVIVLVGCSSTTKTTDTASAGMVNSKCPYSGHAVDGTTMSDLNGQKVGFCCGDCKAKFDKADAQAKTDLVAKVKN